jgi:uncharacterized membrane protein YphA (DoxX/SURF4 family)
MIERYGLVLARYFLSVLFLATGIGKLLDNRGFAQVIASYQLGLPAPVLLPLALAVSLAEFGIGLNLLAGRQLSYNVLATLVFHLGYASLAAITLVREIPLSNCGCFGVFLARPLLWTSVVEDLVLGLISFIAWRLLASVRS